MSYIVEQILNNLEDERLEQEPPYLCLFCGVEFLPQPNNFTNSCDHCLDQSNIPQ